MSFLDGFGLVGFFVVFGVILYFLGVKNRRPTSRKSHSSRRPEADPVKEANRFNSGRPFDGSAN